MALDFNGTGKELLYGRTDYSIIASGVTESTS